MPQPSRSSSGIQLEPLPQPQPTSPPAARDTVMPPRSTSDGAPAPFQTLTGSQWQNRTGTWSGTGATRSSVVPIEETSLKKPLIAIAAIVLLAAAGYGFYLWNLRRTAVTRMIELASAGSYGVAENLFNEYFDTMKNDPRALAIVPDMLAKRREIENDEARLKVKHDPSYQLQPSKWLVTYSMKEMKRSQRFYCVFVRVDDRVFEGYLDWPDAGVRAATRGMRHGNHLVFWDYEVIEGARSSYSLDDKKNLYIMGDKFIGTDGPFQASIEGVLQP
jgi:hypothetical protein